MIHNKPFFIFFSTILVLIACKTDQKPQPIPPKPEDIRVTVDELSNTDQQALDGNCLSLPVNHFKRVGITNVTYDTVWVAVRDLCHLQTPFLLYDRVKYFNADTLVSTDLITTSSGYEIPLLKNDSTSVYFRAHTDQYKQEVKFDVRTSMPGAEMFKECVFKVNY